MEKFRLTLLVLALVAFVAPSCGMIEAVTGKSPDELAAAAQDRAAQDMVADGIDPATATPDTWKEYLGAAAKAIVLEELAAAEPEPGSLQAVLGLTFPQLAKAWGMVAALLALVTNRGRENLTTVFSARGGAKGSALALSALALGTHTPQAAKTATA